MSEEDWDAGLKELNPVPTCRRYSRLGAVRLSAARRLDGRSTEEQAAYWVAQLVECAERHLW